MPLDPKRTEGRLSVAGIVLAAGQSSRMGKNKLLLELDGQPILRRVATAALEAGLSPVIVVLGYEAELTRNVLTGLAVETVINPAYERGMNSSVQLGVAHVPADAAAAVVILADMPLVTSQMIANLVERYRSQRAPLVISRFGDVRAPPTLYDRSLFDEFTATEGDGCGRRIVREHLEEAVVVRLPPDALADLDSVEDYEHLKKGARGTS